MIDRAEEDKRRRLAKRGLSLSRSTDWFCDECGSTTIGRHGMGCRIGMEREKQMSAQNSIITGRAKPRPNP